VVPGSLITEGRLSMMTQGFIARGMDLLHAQQAALQVLNGQVQRQATMLGFNDAWILVLIVFAAVSPAILLLRRPKPSATPVAAEAH
jgi:DHA2 family multidrug resistance protein